MREGDWANICGKEGCQPVVGMVLSMGEGCSHKGKWIYSVFSPKGFCWDNLLWNIVFIPRFKRWLKTFFFFFFWNFHWHCLLYLWAVFYSLLSMHHMQICKLGFLIWEEKQKCLKNCYFPCLPVNCFLKRLPPVFHEFLIPFSLIQECPMIFI